MRLGFEVSRFPDFCEGGGLACAELPMGVESMFSLGFCRYSMGKLMFEVLKMMKKV